MRKTPLKLLALMLGGPLLMDMLLLMGLFSMTLMSKQAVRPWMLALISAINSLGYAATSHWVGRVLTPSRAERMVIASSLAAAALAGAVCFTGQFWAYLALSGLMGIAAGFYFAPFQVKVGHIQPFATLAWTVAFYNISWGSGLALGPFIGSVLLSRRPLGPLATIAVITLLHLWLCLANRRSPQALEEATPARDFASTPSQRRSGWLGVLTASALLTSFSPLWSALGQARGLSDVQIGLGVLILGAQVPLWSLVWPHLRSRMRRPRLLAMLLAVAGLGFGLVPLLGWPWPLLPLTLAGTAISGIYFHSVYYSNADALNHGRSVSTNQVMVGLGAIIGPVALGLLAWDDARSLRPYLAGCALALVVAATVLKLARRRDQAAILELGSQLCQQREPEKIERQQENL